MYSFIVLGYIPGTNIQISFQAWMMIAAGLTCFLLLAYVAFHSQHSISESLDAVLPTATTDTAHLNPSV